MATTSKDYDVREALVRQFISEGVPRSHLRHEITLGTSSSEGRTDLVVIHDNRLKSCEIKSGADTLKNLEKQDLFSSLAFDATARILDKRHFGDKQPTVRAVYCHDTKRFVAYWRGEYIPIEDSHWRDDRKLVTSIFSESPRTNIVSMANLLWRDELLEICGAHHKTRWACQCWLKEYGRLSEFRKHAIERLIARPLSKWEEAFWKRFDANSEKRSAP
jgi:hypothetical protein